jgi:hypothetical protein
VTNLVRAFCRRPGMNCYDLLGSITGKNYCLNSSAVDVFLKYEPQPTSTKTMVHFAQSMNNLQFLRNPSIAQYVRMLNFVQNVICNGRHAMQPCATAC